MKYVVMEVKLPSSTDGTLEVPFIFPELLAHIDMATIAKVLLEDQFEGSFIKAISAGFLSSMSIERDCCHGKSETLNLESRPKRDSMLVIACDYGSMYA